ncbi:hypothetical protein ACIBH1_12200 [Nonomuraea sp. NPDC050663]|uniref:hypothetical protein n=1 Tax=Nonomuraea sp. NPDC050663 TaxID=3364370 RepID=UPI0037ACB73C
MAEAERVQQVRVGDQLGPSVWLVAWGQRGSFDGESFHNLPGSAGHVREGQRMSAEGDGEEQGFVRIPNVSF